jgi:hypothetical protein
MATLSLSGSGGGCVINGTLSDSELLICRLPTDNNDKKSLFEYYDIIIISTPLCRAFNCANILQLNAVQKQMQMFYK